MSATEAACPACGAAVGVACHVPISGVDTTGWSHDARILAPLVEELRQVRATGGVA